MARRATSRSKKRPAQPAVTKVLAGAAAPVESGRRPNPPSAAPEAIEPEALVATHWFDSGDEGEPYSARVRLRGRRVGIRGNPKPGDTFLHDEAIETVVPGTGPVSVTSWLYGLEPGQWTVDAEVIGARSDGGTSRTRPTSSHALSIRPAVWSWRRWAISSAPTQPLKTRWAVLAPLARQPAVLPGSYTALAVLGFVVALAVQAAILGRQGVSVGPSMAVSVLALVAGLIGAKLWYAVLHPDESILRGGWAVDGFLVVAPLVAVVLLHVLDLPIGTVLDATAPGILFAVAIGRIGCFLTGCCAGRCTASRWGIWSSDRRVGARRVPAQLLESAAGFVIGIAALLLVLADAVPVHGAAFAITFGAYAVIRQLLLRLRAEKRKAYRTLPMTAAASSLVVLAVGASSLLHGA